MSLKDCATQTVELPPLTLSAKPLPIRLVVMKAALVDQF